jgi:hypothetical protein
VEAGRARIHVIELGSWHASRATRVRTLSGHYSPTGLWIAREQEMSERRLSLWQSSCVRLFAVPLTGRGPEAARR